MLFPGFLVPGGARRKSKMATPSGSFAQNGRLNLPNILRALERGLVCTRFSKKRNPERRTFQVKLETRQLIWLRQVGSGSRPEGTGRCIVFVYQGIPNIPSVTLSVPGWGPSRPGTSGWWQPWDFRPVNSPGFSVSLTDFGPISRPNLYVSKTKKLVTLPEWRIQAPPPPPPDPVTTVLPSWNWEICANIIW